MSLQFFRCHNRSQLIERQWIRKDRLLYTFMGAEMKSADHRLNRVVVTLKLNQQQLELIDRTIARGIAPDRESLIRLALREYAAARAGKPASGTAHS
jgi:Ribbon-helix-helix protein, copG family